MRGSVAREGWGRGTKVERIWDSGEERGGYVTGEGKGVSEDGRGKEGVTGGGVGCRRQGVGRVDNTKALRRRF